MVKNWKNIANKSGISVATSSVPPVICSANIYPKPTLGELSVQRLHMVTIPRLYLRLARREETRERKAWGRGTGQATEGTLWELRVKQFLEACSEKATQKK